MMLADLTRSTNVYNINFEVQLVRKSVQGALNFKPLGVMNM